MRTPAVKKAKSSQKPLTSFFFAKSKDVETDAPLGSSKTPQQSLKASGEHARGAEKPARSEKKPDGAGTSEVIDIENSPTASTAPGSGTTGKRSPPVDTEVTRPAKRAKVNAEEGDAAEHPVGEPTASAEQSAASTLPASRGARLPKHSEERHKRFQVLDIRPPQAVGSRLPLSNLKLPS